jgi:hypothetical protein
MARLPQNNGSASPAAIAPGIARMDGRVDDLHRRDRHRVGCEGQAPGSSEVHAIAEQRTDRQRVTEQEREEDREQDGRQIVPAELGRDGQPEHLADREPVRQCTVAEMARRSSDGAAWPMRSTYRSRQSRPTGLCLVPGGNPSFAKPLHWTRANIIVGVRPRQDPPPTGR